MKRLKTPFQDWEECKRLREVQALTKLKHRNIIKCTEVILERNNLLYLVFEFAPRNLWQLLKAEGPMGAERVASLTAQLLSGLQHMHKYGFFHRDIKPENVLSVRAPSLPAARARSLRLLGLTHSTREPSSRR